MRERRKDVLRVGFDRRPKLEIHGATVTSDAGLITHWELDETFSLTNMADDLIKDRRTGKNTQHGLVGFFRQSIYSRLAGYEDTNDAERLRRDPTRSGRTKERPQRGFDEPDGTV
jgi:hypothetical protein